MSHAALDAAVAMYRRADARTRMHVRLRRALSCMETIEPLVPSAGRVLEVGCGHGLFSQYLSLAAPGRQVLGIDLDVRKIAAAIDGRGQMGRVEFAVGDALSPPEGPFDAVVFVDVLYLLDAASQGNALAAARHILNAGGVLVCKAQEPAPAWKYRLCRTQEWLATRLGITEGNSLTFLPRREMSELLLSTGFSSVKVLTVQGRVYPDVIYTAIAG